MVGAPLVLVGFSLAFQPLLSTPPVVSRRFMAATMQMDLGKLGGDFMKKAAGKAAGAVTGIDMSEEETKEMEERLKTGDMTFDDFLKQVQMMQKAGNLQSMLKNGPFGGGNQMSNEQLAEGQKKLNRYGSYVDVMTDEEKLNPALIIEETAQVKAGTAQPERLVRIAEEAGSSVEEVGNFVTEFNVLRSAAKKFAAGENPDTIREEMMAEQQAGGVRAAPNRAMRRAAKKRKGKGKASAGGFGR